MKSSAGAWHTQEDKRCMNCKSNYIHSVSGLIFSGSVFLPQHMHDFYGKQITVIKISASLNLDFLQRFS